MRIQSRAWSITIRSDDMTKSEGGWKAPLLEQEREEVFEIRYVLLKVLCILR